MILFSLCTSSAGIKTLLILKIALQVICTIIPLVVMYRAFAAMLKNVKEGGKELGKDVGNVVKSLIAGLIVFFIPTMMSYTFSYLLGNDSDFITCMENATLEGAKAAEEREAAEAAEKKKQEEEEAVRISKEMLEKRKRQILETYKKRLEQGWYCTPLDYKYEGNGTVKAKFSSKTMRIVEKHINDFNYSNFNQVISSYGGFENYMKSLGGVFAKYYGRELEINNPCDLQDVGEYVFGMMYMYGFDYFSGLSRKYCKWGGSCLEYSEYNKAKEEGTLDKIKIPSGDSDAFYPGSFRYDQHGLSNKDDFDALISGRSGLNMTTNCNWTVDMVYYKAGVFGKQFNTTGASPKSEAKNGIIIDKVSDIAVGDIVHFYKSSIDKNDPSTWNSWYHVAFIGEVDKKAGTVTGYDGGSYYQLTKTFKWTSDLNGTKLFGTENWVAIRLPIGLDPDQLKELEKLND